MSQPWKRNDGKWVLLWICPVSGNVIGDSSKFVDTECQGG